MRNITQDRLIRELCHTRGGHLDRCEDLLKTWRRRCGNVSESLDDLCNDCCRGLVVDLRREIGGRHEPWAPVVEATPTPAEMVTKIDAAIEDILTNGATEGAKYTLVELHDLRGHFSALPELTAASPPRFSGGALIRVGVGAVLTILCWMGFWFVLLVALAWYPW